MEITVNEKENNVIITLDGRLDTSNYEEFSAKLKEIIDSGKRFLVFNLKGLEYISSSGLRVFLSTLKTLRLVEGDVILCCLNETIKSVFEVSGFLSLFRVEESVENL